MRGYVPMMLLQIRVALAEGNFVAAAHGLETGFAFSRHVADGPFLINRLVGIACASQFLDCLLDFVARPGAPESLLVACRSAATADRSPRRSRIGTACLRVAISGTRGPEPTAVGGAVGRASQESADRLPAPGRFRPRVEGGALEASPRNGPERRGGQIARPRRARKRLIEHGNRTAEQVAALPPAQVLLADLVDQYHKFRDDTFKAGYLPFLDAPKAFAAAETRAQGRSRYRGPALRRRFAARGRQGHGRADPARTQGGRSTHHRGPTPARCRTRRQIAGHARGGFAGSYPGRSWHGQSFRIRALRRHSDDHRSNSRRGIGDNRTAYGITMKKR